LELAVIEKSPAPDWKRHEHWYWLAGLMVLLCCVTSLLTPSLMLRAGLPADQRATICLALSRNPMRFSLWWISPNLTSLPHQPLVTPNRIENCSPSPWSPLLPHRGGFDLR